MTEWLSLQAAATVTVIVITMVASFLILLPAFMFMTEENKNHMNDRETEYGMGRGAGMRQWRQQKTGLLGVKVERCSPVVETPLERKDLPLFPWASSPYWGILTFMCYIPSSYSEKGKVFLNHKILL